MLVDLGAMADEHGYCGLGAMTISSDDALIGITVDLSGGDDWELRVIVWSARGAPTEHDFTGLADYYVKGELQLDGEKEVLLWHPNETANFYMDHHDKFGLSPVNVDRVDLERFPSVANATTYYARLGAGDAIYIPLDLT